MIGLYRMPRGVSRVMKSFEQWWKDYDMYNKTIDKVAKEAYNQGVMDIAMKYNLGESEEGPVAWVMCNDGTAVKPL